MDAFFNRREERYKRKEAINSCAFSKANTAELSSGIGACFEQGRMNMAYPFVEKETQIQETRAKYQEALQPFNRPVPQPFPEETRDEYRRRALPILQNYAPSMQEVKVHDMRGTAFDMIERQTFEAARREADRPTMIPDGELREVKRFDQTGRPFTNSMAKWARGLTIFTQEGSDWRALDRNSKRLFSFQFGLRRRFNAFDA